MKMTFGLLAVLLLSFGWSAAAQIDLADGRCERFDQSPGVCQSVLVGSWQQVWTAPNAGVSQEYLTSRMYDAYLSNDVQFVAYLDVLSNLSYSDGCAQAYAQLLCPTFFAPCVQNTDAPTNASAAVLPVPVCRSVCEAVNAACGPLFDCANATSPLTGLPAWPADSPQCTRRPDNATVGAVAYACPPPLRFTPRIPDEYSHTACSSTCHRKLTLLSSMQEFWALWWITTVCSWLSFVLVIVLSVTVLLFPSLRRYPNRVVLHSAVGFFFFHLGAVGASFTGIDYACNSETQLASGIGYCGFYAWCVYFGSLLTFLWWMFQTFVIYYNVALVDRSRRLDAKLEKLAVPAFAVYSLVVSLVLTTVDTQAVGNRGVVPICLSSIFQPTWHKALSYAIFYSVPLGCALLVVIFIGLTLVSVLRRAADAAMARSLVKFFAVMAIFCVYYLVAAASFFTVTFYSEANDQAFGQSISQWQQCVFSWRIDTGDCPLDQFNANLVRWQFVMVSLNGSILFLCFFVLCDPTWRCWAVALSNVANGRPFFEGTKGERRLDSI